VTKLLTRDEVCECTFTTGTGQARPEKCEHGNRYWTERQLNPPERKPLAQKSAKRQAEEESGKRPKQRRGSTLKRGNGFQASKAQRDKVRLLPCVGCGHGADFPDETGVDPAHLWPRGKGGCDHPDCVIPLCRTCHRLFDQGELDLLPRLAGTEAWAKEQAHPILAHGVSPVELVRRLSGGAYEFVKLVERERDSVAA
jgi:hypothetical protein